MLTATNDGNMQTIKNYLKFIKEYFYCNDLEYYIKYVNGNI